MNILVTGGCGFIGSHFIRLLLTETDASVVNLDKLTYAGNPGNLADCVPEVPDSRYTFIRGDICDTDIVEHALSADIDVIVHCAAESHVDRSIISSKEFIDTNIKGTANLLDRAMGKGIKRFVQVSTDEVYGTLASGEPAFRETDGLMPNSPYAASKAGADLVCRSYFKTHGFPLVITRCSNNYGPYQFPEKLIPLMISNAMQDKKLPVYGDGMQVRDWIHVRDHCRALFKVLNRGEPGEIYNIGCSNEQYNIDIVRLVLIELDKPDDLIEFVKDRPGHDRRYSIDSSKIRNTLGWEPEYTFEQGLRETVSWYRENRSWLEDIKTGRYRERGF